MLDLTLIICKCDPWLRITSVSRDVDGPYVSSFCREPIASFIDSLLSGCVGPNEWGLPPVEGAYPVETTHFVHNTGETVAQSHSVMQLEPQLNGMTNSYLQPYNQVQPVQVQIQPQQLQQYQHPTPVSEAHPTPGYHPVPQIQ